MAAAHPQTLSQALPPGTALKEYLLQSVLGMGSFGITYLATDNYLQLKVAIKEYFPASVAVRYPFSGNVALKSEQSKEEFSWGKDRFMREAQTLAQFSHKNIVRVFRYFEANGTCYMVMAYEEGESLDSALAADPARWNQQAVLGLMMPLLEGIESVHAAGFLHRDIKPANIFLRKDGSPVLIDFGAARAPASADALTVVLSHGYGPPEQYSRRGNQGPWTDIYALAGVLYRMVTGEAPPMSLHRVKDDAMLSAVLAGKDRFGAPFLEAIDLALQVDEKARPQSVAEWRKLLLRTAPVQTPAPLPGGGAQAATRPQGSAAAATTPPRQVRITEYVEEDAEPGLAARIGAALIAHPFLSLLLLVVAIYAGLHYLKRPAAPPAPAPQAASPAPDAPAPDAPAPRTRPAEPEMQAPPPADSPDRREPDATAAPDATPAPSGDGNRLRDLRRTAIAACEGKAVGASCQLVTPRSETIDATCATLADGQLGCRPARLNSRQGNQAGAQGSAAEAWRQVPIPRVPR